MSYSIYQAPTLSFFKKDFYRYIGREAKGVGLLYLFVVVTAASVISTGFGCLYLYMDIKSPRVAEVAQKLPSLKIKDGSMSMDKPSPYVLNIEQQGGKEKTTIVFDTAGTKGLEAPYIFREDGFIADGKEDSLVPWKMLTFGNDFELVPSQFQDLLVKTIPWFFGLGLIAIPVIWIGHLFVALIYALVGLVMDRNKLGFGTSMRVATVAMTPCIVLDALFHAAHLSAIFIIWFLVTIPISLGYMYFAYSAINAESP